MKAPELDKMFGLEDRHWWFVARRKIIVRVLSQYLSGPTDILDAGCGTGRMLMELSRFGEVNGFDESPEGVAYARGRGLARVEQASVTAIPFPDASFGVVTCLDVLEHTADDLAAVRELGRILRPEGIVLVTVPAFRFLWSSHDVALSHLRRYRAGEVRRLVETAGLEILKLSYFNTILFPGVVLTRFWRALFATLKSLPQSDPLRMPSPLVNAIFLRLFQSEAALLPVTDLPFGVSILCVGRKPKASNDRCPSPSA